MFLAIKNGWAARFVLRSGALEIKSFLPTYSANSNIGVMPIINIKVQKLDRHLEVFFMKETHRIKANE